jgi:hypothetical protein
MCAPQGVHIFFVMRMDLPKVPLARLFAWDRKEKETLIDCLIED